MLYKITNAKLKKSKKRRENGVEAIGYLKKSNIRTSFITCALCVQWGFFFLVVIAKKKKKSMVFFIYFIYIIFILRI